MKFAENCVLKVVSLNGTEIPVHSRLIKWDYTDQDREALEVVLRVDFESITDDLRQEAYDEGYDNGYGEGYDDGLEQSHE